MTATIGSDRAVEAGSDRAVEAGMPRFIAVVNLSPVAHADVTGPRERFATVEGYLRRRGIAVRATFQLDGTQHLLVLDAGESPTRNLNRALARAWPTPGERPDLARVVNAEPWIRRADGGAFTPPPGPARPSELAAG
jgi:hypothetical protein